jgi:hypothetical protein
MIPQDLDFSLLLFNDYVGSQGRMTIFYGVLVQAIFVLINSCFYAFLFLIAMALSILITIV